MLRSLGGQTHINGKLSLSVGSFTIVEPSDCFVIGFPTDIFLYILIDFSLSLLFN